MLEHRREITRKRPSLPAQASKAFKLLLDASTQPAHTATTSADGKRRLRLSTVVRPEIDVDKLARAFLTLAEHLAEQERKERDDQQDAA